MLLKIYRKHVNHTLQVTWGLIFRLYVESRCYVEFQFCYMTGGLTIIVSFSRVNLPFGAKKIFPSGCRAMIGQVARGGRTRKTMLKTGNAYHIYRVKRNCWPKVRVVAMNPVEHPHGGGEHQHIIHASIVCHDAPLRQKDTLIASRRIGRMHVQFSLAAAKMDN